MLLLILNVHDRHTAAPSIVMTPLSPSPLPPLSRSIYVVILVSCCGVFYCLLLSGIHRPKIVHCDDSAGQKHRQLVKGADDIRQDAVMEQARDTNATCLVLLYLVSCFYRSLFIRVAFVCMLFVCLIV